MRERAGVSQSIVERIFNRLVERGYVSDEKFARWWVENRNLKKGASLRKLQAELRAKGVESTIIEATLHESSRTDEEELQKIIAKKRRRYDDEQKFMQYLVRQGFSYDAVKEALRTEN
jgi:regulatory protein